MSLGMDGSTCKVLLGNSKCFPVALTRAELTVAATTTTTTTIKLVTKSTNDNDKS